MTSINLFRSSFVLVSFAGSLLLSGCGLGNTSTVTKTSAGGGVGTFSIRGNVHGGQQPVGGAAITMYAVGTTGYGSASVSVMKPGVTVSSSTDGTGSFTLTNTYTCTPEQRVYLTATGGNAGSGTNNALAMMAALGRCGDLTSSTFISLNEVTTVASVWALAPFMSGPTNIGAPATNVTGINNAFADVNTLASIARGSAGGDGLPAGTTIPVATINTLANILASCINSNGGSSSTCPTLFGAATSGGNVPTETLTAAINIAQHPSTAVATLYPLNTGVAPFQPTLVDQPSDFTLAATFSAASLSAPSSVATDAAGQAWVVDATTNKLTTLAHSGAAAFMVSGLSAPSAVAVDQSGNGWVANGGNASLTKVSAAGVVAGSYAGGGLSTPKSVSIDGQGNVWVANSGNNTVSEFSASGTAVSASGYSTSGTTPLAVAINPK